MGGRMADLLSVVCSSLSHAGEGAILRRMGVVQFMTEFRERAELLQRIIDLCRPFQQGNAWAGAERKIVLARLKKAYPARIMAPAELARRMGEANRRKSNPRRDN